MKENEIIMIKRLRNGYIVEQLPTTNDHHTYISSDKEEVRKIVSKLLDKSYPYGLPTGR